MVTKHFSYFLNNSRGPLQMQILSKASGITSCCLFARETNILVNVVFRSNFGPVLPCAHWPDTDRHLVGAQSKGWLPKILSYSANVKITRTYLGCHWCCQCSYSHCWLGVLNWHWCCWRCTRRDAIYYCSTISSYQLPCKLMRRNWPVWKLCTVNLEKNVIVIVMGGGKKWQRMFFCKTAFPQRIFGRLYKGRRKYRNIYLKGPATCRKTFLLNLLTSTFNKFSNPTITMFAWVGAEDAEISCLTDFRWSPHIIPWSLQTFLMQQPTLLEVVFPPHAAKQINLLEFLAKVSYENEKKDRDKQATACLNSICTKLPKGRKVFICVC